MADEFYFLDEKHTDPKRVKREREKSRELKKTPWWKEKIAKGICHYCEKKFKPKDLTLDHLVPIARGGESSRNNVVPACAECNAKKRLHTPVDLLFQQLESEKKE